MDKELYNKILIEPVEKGAEKLIIISGYAASTMASRHIFDLNKLNKKISLDLIIGMAPRDGIAINDHNGFNLLMSKNEYNIPLKVSYAHKDAIHSKVYIWLKDSEPIFAFTGSANYTQTAFAGKQSEYMTLCDPKEAFTYYTMILNSNNTVFADFDEIERYILLKSSNKNPSKKNKISDDNNDLTKSEDNSIIVPLLNSKGEVGNASGLNWGQRKGREPNQAYISLRPEVYKSDFFPLKATHFTVITDDDKLFICSRAQKKYGEAIHTPLNNSSLGEYFRNRINIANGKFINKDDLLKYGRTDVKFTKIDEETYFMDFSV